MSSGQSSERMSSSGTVVDLETELDCDISGLAISGSGGGDAAAAAAQTRAGVASAATIRFQTSSHDSETWGEFKAPHS